jgi:serine-type D-Ala-D-Ala carboxypeptidase/endopeptidase (penicillin-binding protein 4)
MKYLPSSYRVGAGFIYLVLGLRLTAADPTMPSKVSTVAELGARIEAHVTQARFAPALWGIKVVSLASGRTLYEHHADRLLSPASNSKLYTAALAFDRLGRDFRMITPLYAAVKPDVHGTVHGDVVVSGRGDPSWRTRGASKNFWDAFEPVVAALIGAGVRQVTGDVVADATFFHGVPNGAGWTVDDLNDDYGAEISAITLEDNYAELRVGPGQQVGAPGLVTWLQPWADLSVDLRVLTVSAGGEKRVVAQRIFGEGTVHLFGEVPLGADPVLVEVTVPRPAAWYARGLKEALRRRGIRVEGVARSVRWPEASVVTASAVKLAEVASPPLHEMVTAFMKPSQNLETDLIFGYIGELGRTPASPAWQTSEELAVIALEEFWKKSGLPPGEMRFEEGSGLSRNNLTTANATVALLVLMAKHPASAEFRASLPIAGVDGSLRRRMQGTAAAGNVRAKTGSLRYAHSLSGYVTTAAGEPLGFSVMLNRNTGQPASRSVREELDDIAVMLADFAGPARGGSGGAP